MIRRSPRSREITALVGGMLLTSLIAEASTSGKKPTVKGPINSDAPILEYFELIRTNPDSNNPQMPSFKVGNLLLMIRSIRSVSLLGDGKGVRVTLNDEDRKKFAELTHKYEGGLLFCQASANPVVAGIGLISAPTQDGVIEFSEARYSGNIADYLRHRFWE